MVVTRVFWLNSQTMRRELKRHKAIESSTARTPW